MYPFPGNPADQENDDNENQKKLSALYGEEWKKIALKSLMKKRFTEIPQFHKSEKICLTGGSVRSNINLYINLLKAFHPV